MADSIQIDVVGTVAVATNLVSQTCYRINFSRHLQILTDNVTQLNVEQKPKLVVVEGQAGSGKSMLAKVLMANGANCEYLDVADITDGVANVDISGLIRADDVTYIIDEPELVATSLYEVVNAHCDNGGTVVMMVQCIDDLPDSLNIGSKFRLYREAFTYHC